MKIEIRFAYFTRFACIMLGIVLTHLIFTQNGQNVSKPPDRWPVAEAVAREGRMEGHGKGGGVGRPDERVCRL